MSQSSTVAPADVFVWLVAGRFGRVRLVDLWLISIGIETVALEIVISDRK